MQGDISRMDQLHATDKTWIVVIFNHDSRSYQYHGPFPTEFDAKQYASTVPIQDEDNRLFRTVGHTALQFNTEWLIKSHANIK